VRVIRGAARGMKLQSVPGEGTRPITDRVKEALFNILGADVLGASFLDLFAGTGSVGIEALSNGAAWVRFVDLNRAAVRVIRSNLEHTNLAQGAEVLNRNALAMLEGRAERAFDYVYIAPPQYHDIWERALQRLDENPGWLTQDAWVIVQIDPKEYKPQTLNNLKELDIRRYGDTILVFYQLTAVK